MISAKLQVISRGRLLVLVLSAALAVALIESSFGQGDASGRAPAKAGEAATKKPSATAPAASRPVRPRWRPRAGRAPLTDEQKAEIMAFAKEYMPELYAQLEKLQKDDPRRARRLLWQLRGAWWQAQRYPAGEVRKAAVARRRLNVEIYKTRKAYGEATDKAHKAKLREQLTRLVGERFDNDQIVKEYDVKRLEKQLADLKAEIAERRRSRAKIIADTMERLLRPLTAGRSPASPGP